MNVSDMKVQYTRLATLKDVDQILNICLSIPALTGYRDIEIDPLKSRRMIEAFLVEMPKETLLLVSVNDKDEVVGLIAGTSFELIFTNERIAIELVWHLNESADNYERRNTELRMGYEEWARRKGYRYAQYAVLNPTKKDLDDIEKNSKSTVLELVYHRKIDDVAELPATQAEGAK